MIHNGGEGVKSLLEIKKKINNMVLDNYVEIIPRSDHKVNQKSDNVIFNLNCH